MNKLTKRPFEKATITYDTVKDMGLSGGSHKFAFWDDPSRTVVMTLLDVITTKEEKLESMSEDEKRQLDADFWKCVSSVMVDCDIEGLDFSTPENAIRSFDNENVSWGYLMDVLMFYVGKLLAENKRLGEVLRLIAARTASGPNKKQKEEKSKSES
jgi:hypothetical protein